MSNYMAARSRIHFPGSFLIRALSAFLVRHHMLVLAALMLAAIPLGAGFVEEKDGKTIIHVKVFGLPNASAIDPASRASSQVVKEFKNQFPAIFAKKLLKKYQDNPARYGRRDWSNVEIQLEPFSGIQVEGVEVDLLAIAGGMAPDILYVNFRKSDNYIQNGFLYPLDKPEDGYFASFTKEDIELRINPKIWPVIKRKSRAGKTHIWSIPVGGTLGKVLLYRKDLFEERGIPFPDENWTWDDMLSAAKKITDYEKGVYGLLLGRGKQESWFWINFLWSAGADVMRYDEAKDQWRCVFNEAGAADALDMYVRLSAESWTDDKGKVRRGYSSKEAENNWVKWERGEIGMTFAYIDEKMFASLNPELTGLTPMPKGPTGMRGGELNCPMAGLFAGITDPVVRDAAWEYLRFTTSKDAMNTYTTMMVESGMGQFINPKYLRMFGYDELLRLCPKGWAEAFDIAIETGKPEPYGTNSNVAYEMMSIPIQEAEQMERNNQLPEDRAARLKVFQELLDVGCARANEKMIGVIAPAEKTKRHGIAYAVLGCIIVVFYFVFRKVVSAFTPPDATGAASASQWDFIRYRYAYIILIPAVASILVWNYIPLGRGSLMAFQDYRIMGDSTWVGVDNLANVLFSADWWQSVYNSLRYSLLIISLSFLPPIILAILLQEVPFCKLLFRLLFYLPAVISGIVTILLWRQFYDPSEHGALNALALKVPVFGFVAVGLFLLAVALMFSYRLWYHYMRWQSVLCAIAGVLMLTACVGLAMPAIILKGETSGTGITQMLFRLFNTIPEPYGWLINPKTAMLSCIIPMVWAGIGPGCLIYLAALKGISDDFYEAADIDGATFIDKILFVVFPVLKPLIIINFIGAFIGSVYSEGNILAMTGGGANTEVAGLHIWYTAFTHMKYGPATAMAWMLGTMLIGFTIYQLRILSRLEFKTVTK